MLGNKINNAIYLSKTVFSDETSFHISGCINRHNGRIWGEQLPNEVFDDVRDSPNVNVMYELVQDRVIKPFVKTSDYLDMLEMYVSKCTFSLKSLTETKGCLIINIKRDKEH